MIVVCNFNLVENSLLEKVANDVGIDDQCRYLHEAVASRGEIAEALGAERGQLPRVIIVNLDCAEVEWSQLVSDLKSHDVWKMIPIMGFGFLDDPSVADAFYQMGGASVIRKPHGYEGLKAITTTAIQYWLDVSFMPCDFLEDVA